MAYPEDNILPGVTTDDFKADRSLKNKIIADTFATQPIKDKFEITSWAVEIEEYCKYQDVLEREYERRKTMAIEWRTDLAEWVADIETGIRNGYKHIDLITKKAYDGTRSHEKMPVSDFSESIFAEYFDRISLRQMPFPGVDNLTTDEIFIDTLKDAIKNIATGVAFAIKLSKWKKELKALEMPNALGTATADQKELKITLKWAGSKTQIYHLMRGLKQAGVLLNSYDDIGVFLLQNVDKFIGADVSTTINELQRNSYDEIPKAKRIDVQEIIKLKEEPPEK